MHIRSVTFLIFIFSCLHLYSQTDVFVLVDVSGSGPSNAKLQAGNIVRDILNNQFSLGKYDSKWEWSSELQSPLDRSKGSNQPLLDFSTNSTLMIMPMGVKERYRDYRISHVSSASEVNTIFDQHYPKTFGDLYSYLEIARAKAAGVARSAGITNYYQIEITDALEDTQSNQPSYAQDEWDLIQSNLSSVSYLGELAYNRQNTNDSYRIIFKTVNINNSKVPKTPILGGVNIASKDITIIKPRGTSKSPTILNPGSISVAWQCLGCKDSTEYTVSIYNTTNKKIRISPRKVRDFNTVFSITESGTYKVSVSGDGASAKSVFFKIEGKGGGSGVLAFLLLVAACAGIWYFWNKRRNEQLNRDVNAYNGGLKPSNPTSPRSKKFDDDDSF